MIETLNRKRQRGIHTPIRRKRFQDSSQETKEELLKNIFKKNKSEMGSRFQDDELYLGYDSPFKKNKEKSLIHILGESDTTKRVSFNDMKKKIIRNVRMSKKATPKSTRKRRRKKSGLNNSLIINSPVSSPIDPSSSLQKIELTVRSTPIRRKKETDDFFSRMKQKTLPSRTKMIVMTKDGSKIMKVYSKPPNLKNEGYEAYDEEIHSLKESMNNEGNYGSNSRPRFVEDRFMMDIMEIEKLNFGRKRRKFKKINMERKSIKKRPSFHSNENETKRKKKGRLRPISNPPISKRMKKHLEEEEDIDDEDILFKHNRMKSRPFSASTTGFSGALDDDRFSNDLSKLYGNIVEEPNENEDNRSESNKRKIKNSKTQDLDEFNHHQENSQNLSNNSLQSENENSSSSPSQLPDFEFESVGEPLRLQYDPTQIKQISSLSSHMVNTTLKDYLIMVEACNRAGKSRLEGLCHYRIATMYEDKGNNRNAVRHFRKFLFLCRQLNDRVGQCLGLNRLGVLHQVMGGDGQGITRRRNIRKALKYHGEHWKLADNQNKIVSHINMGLLFMKYGKGLKNEATDNFKAACRYAIAIGDKHGQSIALANLGVLRKVDGDLGMAKKCIRKQLEISKRIQDEKSRTDAYQKLGVIASRKGDNDEAIKMLSKARKIAVEFNDQHKSNQLKCFLGILKGNQRIEDQIRLLGKRMKDGFDDQARRSIDKKAEEESIIEEEKLRRQIEKDRKEREEEERKEKEREKLKREKEKLKLELELEESEEIEMVDDEEMKEVEESGEEKNENNNNKEDEEKELVKEEQDEEIEGEGENDEKKEENENENEEIVEEDVFEENEGEGEYTNTNNNNNNEGEGEFINNNNNEEEGEFMANEEGEGEYFDNNEEEGDDEYSGDEENENDLELMEENEHAD